MTHTLSYLLLRSKITLFGLFLVTALSAAFFLTSPTQAHADACDKVNIIYCGLDGSDLNGYVNSFQSFYDRGSNNGYDDLKAVFRWAGASNAAVANMNSTNTKIGTLYRNGDVKVDGTLVGQDAWVAARFGAGQNGFVKVTDNAWARKTTTSLQNDTYKLIVHFGTDGNADFAVMVICGNAVKFTPVPQPKPELTCVSLDAVPVENSRTAKFTAQASAKNTTISKYFFDFGDGQTSTQPTAASSLTVYHAYDDYATDHTIKVTVYGPAFPDGSTNDNCTAHFKTPERGNLVCTSLQAEDTNQPQTKKFVATASATNTTITSYVFTITADGTTKTETVTTNASTAELDHTFASQNSAYTATAVVKGTTSDGQVVTSPSCAAAFTPPAPSPPPQQLINTGPGSIAGIFGLTAVAGYLGRHFYLRHKLGL